MINFIILVTFHGKSIRSIVESGFVGAQEVEDHWQKNSMTSGGDEDFSEFDRLCKDSDEEVMDFKESQKVER